MSKKAKATARRERRAARSEGFSNYSRGIQRARDLRAMRSNARAQEREEERKRVAEEADRKRLAASL